MPSARRWWWRWRGERQRRASGQRQAQMFDAFDAKTLARLSCWPRGAVDNLVVMGGEPGPAIIPASRRRCGWADGAGLLWRWSTPATLAQFDITAPVAWWPIFPRCDPAEEWCGIGAAPFAPPPLQAVRRSISPSSGACHAGGGPWSARSEGADKAKMGGVVAPTPLPARGAEGMKSPGARGHAPDRS